MKRNLVRCLPEIGEPCLERGQGLIDGLSPACAFRGKRYTPRPTFQESHPEIDFKLLYPLGDRTARQVKFVRRALQTAEVPLVS